MLTAKENFPFKVLKNTSINPQGKVVEEAAVTAIEQPRNEQPGGRAARGTSSPGDEQPGGREARGTNSPGSEQPRNKQPKNKQPRYKQPGSDRLFFSDI